MAEDLLALEANALRLGLKINRAKCEVIGQMRVSRKQFSERVVVLREVNPGDAILLGAPLLPGSAVEATITAKREALEILSRRLSFMPAHCHVLA